MSKKTIKTKEDLLDRKSKLKKEIRELNTEEKTKRRDVNPFEINNTKLKSAIDGIDSIKSTLGDGLNKSVDYTSGIFDRIKM